MAHTRRELLTGGSLVAAAALAGCSGSIPGLGGGSGDGNGDGSSDALPNGDFERWLPAPSALDRDHYAFQTTAPAALHDTKDALGSGAVALYEKQHPIDGIGSYTGIDAIHRVARATTVTEAEFDRGTVEEAVRNAGFTEDGTRHGYTMFTSDGPRAGAVGDGVLITTGRFSSTDTTDKRPVVEAVVDAGTGNADRYRASVGACDRLLGALGDGHVLRGRTHEAGATFDGAVAEGFALDVGRDETATRAAVVFTDGRVSESAVAEWAGGAAAFYGQDPTTSTDGRTVTASATVPTGEVTKLRAVFPGPEIDSGGNGPTAPQVSFAVEYEATGDGVGRLTITHESGENVRADRLRIQGDGFADVSGADQTGEGRWQGEASGSDGTVVAGDSVVAGVRSDYEVDLVWVPPGPDGNVTVLVEDSGPDA